MPGDYPGMAAPSPRRSSWMHLDCCHRASIMMLRGGSARLVKWTHSPNHTRPHAHARLRGGTGLSGKLVLVPARRRTPSPPSSIHRNSIPAISSAERIALRLSRIGCRAPRSKSPTVARPTSASAANRSCDQFRSARAARICATDGNRAGGAGSERRVIDSSPRSQERRLASSEITDVIAACPNQSLLASPGATLSRGSHRAHAAQR